MSRNVEKRALYPGSFDPTTNGHLYVAKKVSQDFDKGIVAIGVNPEKKGRFPVSEREEMLRETFTHEGLDNLIVTSYGGLLQIDFAEMVGAQYIIRGVRNGTDFSYESDILHLNSTIDQANPRIETRAIITPEEYLLISSSLVMGLLGNEGWESEVAKIVPKPVFKRLVEYQCKKDKAAYGERWNNLWQRTGAKGNSGKVFDDLFKRYSENNRFYHNFSHIKTCLNEFDLVKDKIEYPDALELAIWFHDVIYKSNIPEFAKSKFDDEGASADFAKDIIIKEMKLSPDIADKVALLIMAIKRDNKTLTKDEQYMIDIDTAIFGRSTRLFNIYEQQIKSEFSWAPVEMYRQERARILSLFAPNPPEKSNVFRTEEFINRYEEQAKYNLERTIIDFRS